MRDGSALEHGNEVPLIGHLSRLRQIHMHFDSSMESALLVFGRFAALSAA